jgi:hypothetical protein
MMTSSSSNKTTGLKSGSEESAVCPDCLESYYTRNASAMLVVGQMTHYRHAGGS